MTNANLVACDVELLSAFAEILLWIGKDRAADAIYAAIEGAALPSNLPRDFAQNVSI